MTRSFTIQALAAAVAALLLGACAASKAPPAATGQIVAQIAAGVSLRGDVASVALTLTSLDSGWSTTVQLKNSKADGTGTWSALVPSLRAGSYDVYAAAKDASDNVLFETPRPYPTPAVVTAGGTTTLEILLQERNPAGPFQNTAPSFIGVTANQSAVTTAIQLSASAVDPDGDALTFDWRATPAGTFGPVVNTAGARATTTETVFTPPGNGSYTITVTATDAKGAKAAVSIVVTISGAGSVVANIELNSFPVVQSLTADDVQAQDIHLTAVASDLDGDALAFGWSADCGGTFDPAAAPTAGTSTTVFHLAPGQTTGTCTVTVTVRDGRDGFNKGMLTFGLGMGDRPVFRVDLLPTAVDAGVPAEAKVVPASGQPSSGWTYAWDDGLSGALKGTFTAAPGAADASDRLYTPAACSLLGAGDHVVTLSVQVTDGASSASNVESVPLTVRCPAATAWKFGLMADTQWIGADDGRNPDSDAIDIALQLADRFVGAGVKFVVQVGDLTDGGKNFQLDTRAKFVQPLYDAGIGYFPLRGNHESSAAGATEFARIFPQTSGGNQNATPVDAFFAGTTVDNANLPTIVPPPAAAQFTVGKVVGSPNAALTGLTYAVDYANARLVFMDQFLSGQSMASQLPWINSTLAGNPGHAFTFSHKGLITENHVDVLFGNDPSFDSTSQDTFINSLANNGVRIHSLGHDHMHDRTLVATTDGVTAKVMQLVCASDSSKFYIPAQPSNDEKYDLPAAKFGHTRQTPLAQELNTVGYYVYTVDGARVTVDFYGSTNVSPTFAAGEYLINTTPKMQFAKRESFGYGVNGKQFVVAQGQPYTVVQDAFQGTSTRILDGVNVDTSKDGSNRPYARQVTTGWTLPDSATSSAILTLWGLAGLGANQTDTYVLSMSYRGGHLTDGSFGLAVRNAAGAWVNAVDLNAGGSPTFVIGAYDPSYALGTYGIDPVAGTVWAVVNHAGDFAAASF
jgi:hypothetical protein